MMNKHFSVIVMMLWSLLYATSCEKMVISGTDGPDDADANVVVQVMSFEQQPFPMASTRGDVETACTRLNFIVYDEAGERIRQETQLLGDEGFGMAQFKLQEGRYYLVVLAHSGKGNPTSTNLHKIGFTNKTGYTDTFLYADSLLVGEEEVDCEIQLKRIVSKVQFVFNDALPERADSIRFYWFPVRHDTQRFEIYTIPRADSDKLKVLVTTYRTVGGQVELLTEREISDIPIRQNHITICRGSLFNATEQHQISIDIDTTWDDERIEFSF